MHNEIMAPGGRGALCPLPSEGLSGTTRVDTKLNSEHETELRTGVHSVPWQSQVHHPTVQKAWEISDSSHSSLGYTSV